jgi:hypothetical protein
MAVHRGRWTLQDRAEGIMRALPVSIPAGTAALTVRLDYPRQAGVLDLGCEGPEGFRGGRGRPRRLPSPRTGPPGCQASWSPANGTYCSGCGFARGLEFRSRHHEQHHAGAPGGGREAAPADRPPRQAYRARRTALSPVTCTRTLCTATG